MADTLVVDSVTTAAMDNQGLWGPYYINPTVGALVERDANGPVHVYRTTNGGDSWSDIGSVSEGNSNGVVVFFDQEVPGDNGTLLHIFWQGFSVDIIGYRSFDIATGTLGTLRTVASGFTSTVNSAPQAACKTRNGNLLVAGYDSGTSGLGNYCYRSTDGGATWTPRTSPFESDNNDAGKMFPANTGDGADAALIYFDDSAAQLSVKMYDDSANTWTETLIASSIDVGSVSANETENGFDASVRHSDGAILLASWNLIDNANADLLTWTITPNSIASPGVSASANVLTNTGESGCCAVTINQQNNHVYVAYALGGTWADTVSIKFKVSTDNMATWGTQQDYSETSDDYRRITGPRTIGNDGGRIQWAWFDDDDNDIFVNLVNDVEITEVVNDVTVTPGTASISLSGLAPTVLTPRLVTPEAANITFNSFTPTVIADANVVITPGPASIVFTELAPTVLAPKLVIPGTASIIFNSFAPTVNVNVVVTPGSTSIAFAGFAPTVLAPRLVIPGAASITLTAFAPAVLTPILVVPDPATISVNTFTPTIVLPVTVTSGPASIDLVGFAPTVEATLISTPRPARITIVTFPPSVLLPYVSGDPGNLSYTVAELMRLKRFKRTRLSRHVSSKWQRL